MLKPFLMLCVGTSSQEIAYIYIDYLTEITMHEIFFIINLDVKLPVFDNAIIFKKNIPASDIDFYFIPKI